MENKRIRILIIIGVVCILGGTISWLILQNNHSNNLEGGKNKDNVLVLPDSVAVSKVDDYVQQAYIDIMTSEEPDMYFSSPSLDLQQVVKRESYVDCSGTLQFVPEGEFRTWNFQATCPNEKENATKILTLTNYNTYLIESIKITDGIVTLISKSATEIGVLFFDNDYHLQWEKYFQTNDSATIAALDLYGAQDGFYVLGKVEGNVSGELASIADGRSEFNFLAKYDYQGNRISLINIDRLSATSFLNLVRIDKVEGEKIYLSSRKDYITLENETIQEKHITGDSNEELGISGITETNQYYAFANKENVANETVSEDEEKLYYTTGVLYFIDSADGTILWEKSMDELSTCDVEHSCSIIDIYSQNEQLFVVIANKVLIFDYSGNLVKTLDYGAVQLNDKKQAKANVEDIVFDEDSYSIISTVDDQNLYIENYSYQNQLNFQKNYSVSGLYMLNGLSDFTIWDYQKEQFNVYFLINEYYGTIASVKIF